MLKRGPVAWVVVPTGAHDLHEDSPGWVRAIITGDSRLQINGERVSLERVRGRKRRKMGGRRRREGTWEE